MSTDGMSEEVERICGAEDLDGRPCLQPQEHKGDCRNGEHAWPNKDNPLAERVRADSLLSLEPVTADSPVPAERFTVASRVPAEPWVTVGFVAEPGDPEDTYRLSITCGGVTHYLGALIEGWEEAELEARAVAGVLGRDATIGPIWRGSECDESGWKFPVAGPDGRWDMVAKRIVAFGVMDEGGVVARAQVNGLVAEDDCDDFNRTLRPGELVPLFARAPAKRATVWPTRPLLHADTSPPQEPVDPCIAAGRHVCGPLDAPTSRETLAEALYESWCEGVQVGKGCFSPYTWEVMKTMAEPDHIPNPEQFYQKADAVLVGKRGMAG